MTVDAILLDWPALVETEPAAKLIPKTLRAVAVLFEAEAGETLFRIGDPVRQVYLVISGEIRLTRSDRNGTEIILQRSRGGFIAEASLDSKAFHCQAVAAEPSKVLLFPVASFRTALESEANFCKGWQSHLARELRRVRAQCERLNLHNAADRVTHYIESEGVNGAIELHQSRKAWAAELGLTHESLYRTLRRMQDEGVLKVDGHQFSTFPFHGDTPSLRT